MTAGPDLAAVRARAEANLLAPDALRGMLDSEVRDEVRLLLSALSAQAAALARAIEENERATSSESFASDLADVANILGDASLAFGEGATPSRVRRLVADLAAARELRESEVRIGELAISEIAKERNQARASADAQRRRAEELEAVIKQLARLHPNAVHPGSCLNHGFAVGRVLMAAGFGLATGEKRAGPAPAATEGGA